MGKTTACQIGDGKLGENERGCALVRLKLKLHRLEAGGVLVVGLALFNSPPYG
jgi:hypothetical protein